MPSSGYSQFCAVLLTFALEPLETFLVKAEYQCTEPNGLFAGSRCGEYYECEGGKARVEKCLAGLGFHPIWKQCTWEGFVGQCVTEKGGALCGNVAENGSEDPWTVAVLQNGSSGEDGAKFEYMAPGLVLSPTSVLTTCQLGRSQGTKFELNLNPSSYQVLPGSMSLDGSVSDSSLLKVKYIKLNPRSRPDSENFCNALMVLNDPLDLTKGELKAACLPFFRDVDGTVHKHYANAKIVTSAYFKRRGQANYQKTVKSFSVGNDPYCQSANGSFICKAGLRTQRGTNVEVCTGRKSVSAIYNPVAGRWNVLGVGTLYKPGMCYFYPLDNDAKLSWIVSVLRCGDSQFPCNDEQCIDLGLVCNGSPECGGGEDEDARMCSSTSAAKPVSQAICAAGSFRCTGSTMCIERSKVCDNIQDCPNGDDEDVSACASSEAPPTTPRLTAAAAVTSQPTLSPNSCPLPAVPEGIQLSCSASVDGPFDSCKKAVSVGTFVQYTCSSFYQPTGDSSAAFKKCGPDLQWTPQFGGLECQPDCGKLSRPDNVNTNIVHGFNANRREFPWHAAIFVKAKNELDYICGGTLIRPSIVITAAHCIITRNPRDYVVILAASSSVFQENSAALGSQIRYLSKIEKHESYDARNNFLSDIALMQLGEPARMSENVNVACVFRDSTGDPLPGDEGEVPGFGKDESGNVSRSLKVLKFPVVDSAECFRKTNIRPQLGQFCGGFTNGSGVCNGDSGGGYVFQQGGKFYLRGIVSIGAKNPNSEEAERLQCNYDTYSIFTSIASFFQGWINPKMNALQMSKL